MKKFLLYIIFLLLASNLDAQVNLVPNPSFEIYSNCPTGGSQIYYAIPWNGVTTNSSDYYNACSSTYNVPFCGEFQYARTGVAFAGLYAINSFGADYKEYLQVKLDSALQQDTCYLVEFYCNLISASLYAVNKMGAYLSSIAVNTVGPLPNGLVLQYTPQIVSNHFLSDTLNWMRVGGYYKASGGEQYLTIGNFSTDSTTDTLPIGSITYNGSYYFIDDVTVKKIAGCDTTANVSEYNNDVLFKLYPNPNHGEMIFEYTLPLSSSGKLIMYDVAGKEIAIYSLDENENKLKINQSQLNNGVYFYSVIINNRIKEHNKIIILK